MRLLFMACAGGAVGAGVRYLIAMWFAGRQLADFPWATLLINITGSALMGLLVGWALARGNVSPELRVFLATGVLGGYTTFSAFSLEAWQLAESGQTAAAGLYVVGSVILSIAALGAGLLASRWLLT